MPGRAGRVHELQRDPGKVPVARAAILLPMPLAEERDVLRQDGNTMRGVKCGFGMLFTPHGSLTRHVPA